MENQNRKGNPNVVLVAGIIFNLTIGVLYAWSVLTTSFTAPIDQGGFGWTSSQAGLPYTVTIIVFATAMLIGGRIQDKIGPRIMVTIGGLLAGLGIILSGLVGNSVLGVTISFGVIAGIGMGFGYGCVSPPALKWFHPSKKGLVSGLIVGGFGLSAVYFAPLTSALLNRFGIRTALLIIGAGILIVAVTTAQFVRNPPEGYTPPSPGKAKATVSKTAPTVNFTQKEMLKTKRFYLLFIMFLLTSSVGLMVIGNMTRIAQTQANITGAVILAGLVSFLAFMNTVGRVIGGMISDKIGRLNTLYLIFGVQMLNMAGFMFYSNLPLLIIGIIGVGFCFGALLSVFPALTADQYGLKNFGGNYGIMFMAWGLSGIAAPMLANYLYDTTGTFTTAFIICAVMMVMMIFINFVVKRDIDKVTA